MTDLSAEHNARLMGPYLDEVASSVSMPEHGLDELLAMVARTPQRHRRRFMPPPDWTSRYVFDATKLLVAGVIVALFGGLVLAGVLTPSRETEALIAGSTPTTSTTAPVESIQAELLPSVELVTQQVSPTVFRVVDDGPGHDLSHIWQVDVDQNDAVWILTMQPDTGRYPRIFRLGQLGAYTPADGVPKSVGGIEVGTDDRLYAYAWKPNSRVTLDDWVVLTEQGWMPATKEDRQAANRRPDKSVGPRVTAADGTAWEVGTRNVYHQGPDGRTEYRLEDMGFGWGRKWLKATGAHMIRPRTLAAAPDGRVWSLWLHGNKNDLDAGLALAEFDGETWKDITPLQWRYRKTWPFGDDRTGAIVGPEMSVGADGTLRLTVGIHDVDIQVEGLAPAERVVASWDGTDWTIESRTSWDLASIPEPSGPLSHIWIAHWASDGTMVLQTSIEGLDTLLYIIEPEIDDSLDEDALMAP